MTRRDLLALPLALLSGPPDSLAIYPTVTSADHQWPEGVFDLTGDVPVSLMTPPSSELHRWLMGHRGQKIVLSVREWRQVR